MKFISAKVFYGQGNSEVFPISADKLEQACRQAEAAFLRELPGQIWKVMHFYTESGSIGGSANLNLTEGYEGKPAARKGE